MKKVLIILGIVLAFAALIVFSRMTSMKSSVNIFAEAKKGLFEITVSNSGELMADKSVDVRGPVIGQATDNNNNRQGQTQGGGNRGGGGGGMMGGMGGGNMRAQELKIQEIIPEGTIVQKGDFIAQLDRSNYTNTLKTEMDNLTTLQNNVSMKILDTAVVLTNLRDDIKNQSYVVEEASLTLEQSKFEPPATIRKAQMDLERQQRALEQKIKTYTLKISQNISDIQNQKIALAKKQRYVEDLQNYLAQFTVTAPSAGMVIYKRDRDGSKRKEGSQLNAFDMVVATLPDLSTMLSKIYVNEIDISKVKIGQIADVVVDAFPKKQYSGTISLIANVGEVLPNSDAKMFEVQIKIDGEDPDLRPAMTTSNKIHIKSISDAVFVPAECVQTGVDSVPFVVTRSKTKHIVVLGDVNDKNIVVEKGLDPGTSVYVVPPSNYENFKLIGQNLIQEIKGKAKAK